MPLRATEGILYLAKEALVLAIFAVVPHHPLGQRLGYSLSGTEKSSETARQAESDLQTISDISPVNAASSA